MTTLTTIARTMRQQLLTAQDGHGVTKHILFGGLVVVMERKQTVWRLAVGRDTAPPSRTEVEVITRDFGLPAGIEWNWTKREQKKIVRGKRSVSAYVTHWQIAECHWREREAVPS